MTLTRCRDQKSRTIDEFYEGLSESVDGVTREIGRTMLALIARLRATPDTRQVYGLTSHYRLCLLASDTCESPCFVIVSALNARDYFIEYLMPDDAAPWAQAYIRGEARSEDEAVRMVLIAINNSEGW